MLAQPLNSSIPAPASPASYSTDCTSSGNQTSCESKANKPSGGTADSFQRSYAASSIALAHGKCMAAKGWKRVS